MNAVAAGMVALGMVMLIVIIKLVYSSDVRGFWELGDEFRQKSGLQQMILYFGDANAGYLMMSAVPNQVLYNDVIDYHINPFSTILTIGWHSDAPPVLPSRLRMAIDIKAGHMMLKDVENDTLYAELFRNNQMSKTALLSIGDSSMSSNTEPVDS